jgi:NAD(P)H dehydrogenase (quinone)
VEFTNWSNDVILITGTTGHVGRGVAKLLSERSASIRLMARHPDRLTDFPAAERVRADYADPASLTQAFKHINKAFMIFDPISKLIQNC